MIYPHPTLPRRCKGKLQLLPGPSEVETQAWRSIVVGQVFKSPLIMYTMCAFLLWNYKIEIYRNQIILRYLRWFKTWCFCLGDHDLVGHDKDLMNLWRTTVLHLAQLFLQAPSGPQWHHGLAARTEDVEQILRPSLCHVDWSQMESVCLSESWPLIPFCLCIFFRCSEGSTTLAFYFEEKNARTNTCATSNFCQPKTEDL